MRRNRLHTNLEYLGHHATFYLPFNKAKKVEEACHDFFLENYNGFTTEESSILGYWRKSPEDPILKDNNLKYVVSFKGREKIKPFIDFIAYICAIIEEDCIWLTMGRKSYLVFPKNEKQN